MKWDELPGSYDWDRKLAYFLDPANQTGISKEDLQDALAILSLDSVPSAAAIDRIKQLNNILKVQAVDLPEKGEYPAWMA